MSYSLVLGDSGPSMPVYLSATGGASLDAAYAAPFVLNAGTDTATLHYVDPAGVTHVVALAITNAAQGTCQYSWQSGDLPAVGVYRGQAKVARSGDSTFPRTFPDDGSNLIWNVYAQVDTGNLATAQTLTTADPFSRKLVPQSGAEWGAVLAAAAIASGPPTSIYNFQESSGSIIDVNGLHNLNAIGVDVYRQNIAGWSRLGAGHTYNGADTGFVQQHGNLPSPDVTSYLAMGYVALTVQPGADSGIQSLTDSAIYGCVRSSLLPGIGAGGAPVSTGGAPLPVGTVWPYALKYDIANKQRKFYTPYEILSSGTFSTVAANTAEVDFGVAQASSIFAATANYVYGSLFLGKAAEKRDHEIGEILMTLGWSPTWCSAPVADATSGKFFPLAIQQWSKLGLPTPSNAWGLQESSGVVFADYIGDIPLIGSQTHSGQIADGTAVTGQTRKALQYVDTVVSQAVGSTDSRLPNSTNTSIALMARVTVSAATAPVPPFQSIIASFGGGVYMDIGSTGKFGLNVGGNHADGAVAQFGVNAPVLLVYDVGNSRAVLYTLGEKITASFTNVGNGQTVWLGSASGAVPAPAMQISHAAMWSGYEAQFDDNGARALFTALGYTVTAW